MWTVTSNPADDMHYLLAMAQLPGKRSPQVTKATARALNLVDLKLEKLELAPSRNWAIQVAGAFHALAAHDGRLNKSLIHDASFGHPEHVKFVDVLEKSSLRQDAARTMLKHATVSNSWSSTLIHLLEMLPAEEVLVPLRKRWSDPDLRDAIAKRLAKEKELEDFDRLIESLLTFDGKIAMLCSNALLTMKQTPRPGQIATAIRALERHQHRSSAAKSITSLLQNWSGQKLKHDNVNAWYAWHAQNYPDDASLSGRTPGGEKNWRKRVAAIDFTNGDAVRGKMVFAQRLCARCHTGSKRLGPSLKGITKRFRPQDFYLHVYEPNAAISNLYKAIEYTLKSGEVYIGVKVYESPAATIIESGMGELIRLNYHQIKNRRPATRSPMPENLMIGASDQDLINLYAYLKTLQR